MFWKKDGERDGETGGYLRAPAFKSLGSQREGRHRHSLGLKSQNSGHLEGHISRKFYANQTSPKGSINMQYGSGSVNLPTVECQLASKYVTSRPIDLPTVPAKTELDEETNRILEDMALEKQTCEEDYCSNFEDQVYSISLVEIWMKGYEQDVKKLKELGFDEDLISLSFAALPVLSTIPNTTVIDNLSTFCTNFNQMKGMGFSQATIFGALLANRNNLETSITSCLNS